MSDLGRLPGLERNVVIAASAGTGKTQLLTGIYLGFALGLAEDGKQVATDRIIATTFSRAAAAEIRERLETRLQLLSKPETRETDSLTQLARERGLADDELSVRAMRVLDELPRSTIDTLHGLATSILRQHALELGLSPNFSIIDQEQAFADAEGTIDDVLSEAMTGPLAKAATRLLDSCYGLERARKEITLLLGRLDEEGLPARQLAMGDNVADARAQLDALATVCEGILRSEPCALTPSARAAIEAIGRTDYAALRSALGEFAGVRMGTSIRQLPFYGALAEFMNRLAGSSKLNRLESIALHAERAAELDADARGANTLLAQIQSELNARRRRDGTLGFGDVLRLARDALRDQPDLAAISARSHDVLLVDEFQDTSRVQRDLLLLLRERPGSIAERAPGVLPSAADIRPRGLIVVGDRKQSIYAFRGAEVSVFAQLAAELAGEEAAQRLELRGVVASGPCVADFHTLTENYRSSRAILCAVNTIARADFSKQPERAFEIRYTAAEELVLPAAKSGDDEGRVTLVEDDGAPPEDPATSAVVRNAEGSLRSAFAAAGLCAKLVRSGTRIADIALLARRRATLPLLELALDRLNIPFVVAGRALFATPEVRDLFAALSLCLNPSDRRALAVIARGPYGGLSDRTLAELCTPRRGLDPPGAWAIERVSDLTEHAAVMLLSERLLKLRRVAPRLSPRNAVAAILREFELEALYSLLPRGQTRLGNAERLLEIAARQGGNLPSFTRWLERQIENGADESEAAVFSEEDAAVRLLTIHGSKGLAFPTTILLDTGSVEQANHGPLTLLRGSSETSLVIRQATDVGSLVTPLLQRANEESMARARAERQRLSYVALTRARQHLVIVLPPGKLRADTLSASVAGVSDSLQEIPGFTRVSATALLTEGALTAMPSDASPSPPPNRPNRPRVHLATIGVTALSDFAICPRRFELSHLFGVAEPRLGVRPRTSTTDDPRVLGSAAHRVLESFPSERWGGHVEEGEIREILTREGLDSAQSSTAMTAQGIARFLAGEYARQVRADGSRISRELSLGIPFRLANSEHAPTISPQDRARAKRAAPGQLELFALEPRREAPDPQLMEATIVLKATLDLVIERADGSIDIIDYKRSRGGDEARYAFQLAAYREAARRNFGKERIRTGLVHLLGEDNEPQWQAPPTFDFFELGTRLIEARFHDRWPGIIEPRCRSAQCGFVLACHPRNDRG